VFLAVPLPSSAKRALLDVQGSIDRGAPGFYRWSTAEQMHLTLYFLGETESVEPIVEALEQVDWAAPTVELTLRGLVLMPEQSVPRIVAAGIGGDVEKLRRLQQRVADTVFPIAAFKETRGFSPHVTIGRLKHGMPGTAKALKRTLAEARLESTEPFVVDGFEMVQSTSGPGGSTYASVHRFTLS
jgi:2'-5' RNA ligase